MNQKILDVLIDSKREMTYREIHEYMITHRLTKIKSPYVVLNSLVRMENLFSVCKSQDRECAVTGLIANTWKVSPDLTANASLLESRKKIMKIKFGRSRG